MTNNTSTSPRRSWELIVLTAALAVWQAGMAVRALQIPPELAAQISLSLPLEFVAGGLWALLFAFITVNLLRQRPARAAILALSGFFVYSLARLLLFVQADYDQNRLPFLIAVMLCLLVFAAVSLLRR